MRDDSVPCLGCFIASPYSAIEAIAEREDPSLQPKVEPGFADRNARVRYTAAAAVIRLSSVAAGQKEKDKEADKSAAVRSSGQ
jgi:HEAT repeat protein